MEDVVGSLIKGSFSLFILSALAFVAIKILKALLPHVRSNASKVGAKADEFRANQGTSLRKLKRLETLASLRDNGAITAAEFEAEKAKIMR
jgi:hypothetical protein